MTPEEAIAKLDRFLDQNGEDILLRRPIGTAGNRFDCACRAKVRGYTPMEIVQGNGIVQGDTRVILSPTDLDRGRWPGAATGVTAGDQRVPRTTDQVVIDGKVRTIKAAAPVVMNGALVRIDLQVRG